MMYRRERNLKRSMRNILRPCKNNKREVAALGIVVESPQHVIGRGLETESPTARVYKAP
jgi:hypothetical protein